MNCELPEKMQNPKQIVKWLQFSKSVTTVKCQVQLLSKEGSSVDKRKEAKEIEKMYKMTKIEIQAQRSGLQPAHCQHHAGEHHLQHHHHHFYRLYDFCHFQHYICYNIFHQEENGCHPFVDL